MNEIGIPSRNRLADAELSILRPVDNFGRSGFAFPWLWTVLARWKNGLGTTVEKSARAYFAGGFRNAGRGWRGGGVGDRPVSGALQAPGDRLVRAEAMR